MATKSKEEKVCKSKQALKSMEKLPNSNENVKKCIKFNSKVIVHRLQANDKERYKHKLEPLKEHNPNTRGRDVVSSPTKIAKTNRAEHENGKEQENNATGTKKTENSKRRVVKSKRQLTLTKSPEKPQSPIPIEFFAPSTSTQPSLDESLHSDTSTVPTPSDISSVFDFTDDIIEGQDTTCDTTTETAVPFTDKTEVKPSYMKLLDCKTPEVKKKRKSRRKKATEEQQLDEEQKWIEKMNKEFAEIDAYELNIQ